MEEKQPLRERVKKLLWSIRDDRKKQLLVGGVGIGVLILFIGGIVFAVQANKTVPQNEVVEIVADEEPENFTVRRFLDGMPVEKGRENAYPVIVMIENLSTIRDLQSGLQNAGVVYEALAEGGITRFAAVYTNYLEEDERVKEIAPVRSARHYFVELAEEYGALYAHAGGSPYALEELYTSTDVINLDQIGGDEGYFYRVLDIVAPHNLNTSTKLLMQALHDKDLDNKVGTYSPWEFKTETSKENRTVTAQSIDIPYTAESYAVRYEYDPEINEYVRFNGGVEHVDKQTKKQIHVKNVVVQFVDTSLLEADSGRLDMTLIGEGKVLVFQEGQVTEGTWRKEEKTARTRFYDQQDEEIAFLPGNIWVSIVPLDNEVTY